MSDGTPNPATWPMCRGPEAYGQATATRIFCGRVDIGVHDTRRLSAYLRTRNGRSGEQHERDEHDVDVRPVLVRMPRRPDRRPFATRAGRPSRRHARQERRIRGGVTRQPSTRDVAAHGDWPYDRGTATAGKCLDAPS